MSFLDPRLPDRFWDKCSPEPMSGCWLWTSNIHDGYGRIKADGQTKQAHRFSYEHLVGPVPAGLQLDHLCRTRSCVNPAHLEAVTQLENARRGAFATATQCKNGHPFTPENTYVFTANGRSRRCCRACNRAAKSRTNQAVAS